MPFLREVSLLQFAVFCLVDVLLVAAAAAHDVELGSWGVGELGIGCVCLVFFSREMGVKIIYQLTIATINIMMLYLVSKLNSKISKQYSKTR